MKNLPIPRLDENKELHDHILGYCRLKKGQSWNDPEGKHKIGCRDAANFSDIERFMDGHKAALAIHDPPYNLIAFKQANPGDFIRWCGKWIDNTNFALAENSSLYVWLGAAQADDFQPLPDFMIMMRSKPFESRSFITMRNQRGYGTSKNWMAVRQELLYYIKGKPLFNVEAEYTDI
ncbi:MAG: site-specific DNA-methyltransferase, partial [Planctomycetota bacterium]